MSHTFSLVCHETKKRVWVGQGWGRLNSFYSGEPKTMAALGRFLREHEGKSLVLLCDDKNDQILEYEEFREPPKPDLWRVGDIVSRTGSDEQEIVEINEPRDIMLFRCIKAPDDGFCKVDDEEWNMPRRYAFVRSGIATQEQFTVKP